MGTFISLIPIKKNLIMINKGEGMYFRAFEKALYSVHQNSDRLNFSDLISQSRQSLGIPRTKIAQFTGLELHRLKNLEEGFFSRRPLEIEIEALSSIFHIDYDILQLKAYQQADEWKNSRKIRVIPEAHYEQYGIYSE